MICVAATLADIWTGQGTRWNRRRRWQCERQGTSRVVLQATQLGFHRNNVKPHVRYWYTWERQFRLKKKEADFFSCERCFFLKFVGLKKKAPGKVHRKTAHRSPCDLRSQTHPTDFISTSKKTLQDESMAKKHQKKTSFWTHQKKTCRDF